MRGKTSPYTAVHSYPLPLGFNGGFAWLYRWFSGRPLNGHRYTDATGFRYGTQSLDPSRYANPYQLLPGYKRFLYARLPVMTALPYAATCWLWPWPMTALTGLLLTLAGWKVWRWTRVREFRRDVVEPVATAVAAATRSKAVAGMGHTWITIPIDFRDDPDSKITINLPPDWLGLEGDKANLMHVVSERLAMEELTPAWSLHSPVPSVQFSVPPQPPKLVSFADARADAEDQDSDAPMVGYGARMKVTIFSLLLDSPHLMIAGGSGAGKSVFLAWLIAQFMRRGAGIVVLDAKYVSHMWLRRIPGVKYASETDELHDTLIWLDGELTRRARFVAGGGDPTTLPPLGVVLEEMNTAAGKLRAYWNQVKPPGVTGMSPALVALSNLASMGREMRVYVLMAGQNLSAKSTGGPEARESFGGRALARATFRQWKMLAPQIKHPPVRRNVPGRWHLVVGDTVREFQVPFINLNDPVQVADLIEWATSGVPILDVPALMSGFVPEVVVTPQKVENTRPEGVTTIREYASVAGVELGTMRMRVNRASLDAVGQEGGAKLYRLEDLDRV